MYCTVLTNMQITHSPAQPNPDVLTWFRFKSCREWRWVSTCHLQQGEWAGGLHYLQYHLIYHCSCSSSWGFWNTLPVQSFCNRIGFKWGPTVQRHTWATLGNTHLHPETNKEGSLPFEVHRRWVRQRAYIGSRRLDTRPSLSLSLLPFQSAVHADIFKAVHLSQQHTKSGTVVVTGGWKAFR